MLAIFRSPLRACAFACVVTTASMTQLDLAIAQFGQSTQFPSEGVASPETESQLGLATQFATGADAGRAPSSTEIPLQKIEPHVSAPVVTALASSRDGVYLAAAGDDHFIRLINASSGRIVEISAVTPIGFRRSSFRPTRSNCFPRAMMAKSCGGATANLRNRPIDSTTLRSAMFVTVDPAWSLAVGGFGNEVGIWDLQKSDWVFKFSCSCGDQRCVRFSPAGDKLLCGGRRRRRARVGHLVGTGVSACSLTSRSSTYRVIFCRRVGRNQCR